jgi:hypothetical protein
MRNFLLTLFIILGLLISCTKDATLSPDTTPFTGKWGGQGISVIASDTQVTLDFDCASGIISKKVLMSNNQFSEKGTYTQFSGNVPINADPPLPKNVQYEGLLSVNNLSLTIKSEDGKTLIGKYTITKGDAGKIVRCL